MNDRRDYYDHADDDDRDEGLEPTGPDDFHPSDKTPPAFKGDDLDDEGVIDVDEDDDPQALPADEDEPAEVSEADVEDTPPPSKPPRGGRSGGGGGRPPAGPSKKRAAAIAIGVTFGLGALTVGGAWLAMGGLNSGPSEAEIERAADTQNATSATEDGDEQQAQVEADSEAADQIAAERSGESTDEQEALTPESGSEASSESDPATGGMDREAVVALIDERLEAVIEEETALVDERFARVDEALEGVRDELGDADTAELDDLRDRVADIEQSVESLAEAQNSESVDERLDKLEAAVGEGEMVERIEVVEARTENVFTALANSRLAVEAVRSGRYNPDQDWREINDASEDKRLGSADERMSEGEASTETLTGWDLEGIGENQALIRSPDGATYMVEPGDRVEDIGDVRAINPDENTVVLRDGVIDGG